MLPPNILIIDSGVGGLSVTENICQQIPSAFVHYIADRQFFPYGALSEAALTQRAIQLVEYALIDFVPDIIVIACNTASTVVLDQLRKSFQIPFVGVVPAIKPAACISRYNRFAVLATPGTVSRGYTQKLIHDFAHDCCVYLIPAPELVELAESKMQGQRISAQQIREATQALTELSPPPDTVVLACTHFPLLRQELMLAFPDITHWVDSGEAIARRVVSLLDRQERSQFLGPRSKNRFSITGTQQIHYDTRAIKYILGDFKEDYVDRV